MLHVPALCPPVTCYSLADSRVSGREKLQSVETELGPMDARFAAEGVGDLLLRQPLWKLDDGITP
jgi:hypothetical protein